MKIAILDDWFDTLKKLPSFEKLYGHDVIVFNDHVEDIDILAERLVDVDALVLFRERTQITQQLLDKLPNLKLISQRSVYPHVDVQACTKNNVLLCSNMHTGTPSFATVEHVWALILASYRQIPQQVTSLMNGDWQMGVGRTLQGRTLGLYGYGRIAKGVEHIAQAFGMGIIWWGSDAGQQRLKDDGKSIAASRADFFSKPDIISVHVRMKPETKGIITAEDFSNMREDALFINTSRAGLLEPDALLQALKNGRPGSAAIDVFDKEPITWKDDPLASHPNVLATPHIGFVTEDEYEVQFSDIYDQIVAYAAGSPINMINPEIYKND